MSSGGHGHSSARSRLLIRLLFDGTAVGIFAGLTMAAVRLCVGLLSQAMNGLLHDGGGAVYFGAMVLLGACVGACRLIEPMISGGGVAQVTAQLAGKLRMNWKKVLPLKVTGCIMTLGSGITMGMEGPSVQIGASVGQAYAESFSRPHSEHRFLISSGASAGLSAAFNAPITGIVFALEELHRNFSPIVLAGAAAAAFAAQLAVDSIMGFQPVVGIVGHVLLPIRDYWLAALLGAVTGLSGVLFNKCMTVSSGLYEKLGSRRMLKSVLPFAVTALFCLTSPELFGSGEPMIHYPMHGNPAESHLIMLYIVKLGLLALAFGSGAPGGIFFPLLVIGSLVGNIFGQTAAGLGFLEPRYVLTMSLMAMAGHFASIVRAPLTGILLVSEMTGSFESMLPLGITAMISYTTAEAFRSVPIYESVMRIIKRRRAARKMRNEKQV